MLIFGLDLSLLKSPTMFRIKNWQKCKNPGKKHTTLMIKQSSFETILLSKFCIEKKVHSYESMSVSSLKLWRKNPRGMGWNLAPSALPPQLRGVKKNYSYLGDCSFCISNFIVCDVFQKSLVCNRGRVVVRKLRWIFFL